MALITPWVRQYTLRDLLDASFDLFKARALTLTLAGLLPYLVVVLYVGIMRLWVLPGMFTDIPVQPAALFAYLTDRSLTGNSHLTGFLCGWLLLALVTFGVGYLAQCRIAVRQALGEDTSIPAAFHRLIVPWLSLLVVGVLCLLFYLAAALLCSCILGMLGAIGSLISIGSRDAAMFFGFLAIECAALVLSLASVFFLGAPVALAHESIGPVSAIGKSFRFAQRNFRTHVFAFYILLHAMLAYTAILYGALSLLQWLGVGFSPLVATMAVSVCFGVGLQALFGMLASLQALAYVDGRCRTEEFDLSLLATAIGMGDVFTETLSAPTATLPPAYPDYRALPASPAVSLPAVAASFPDYTAPPPPIAPAKEDADAQS